MKRLINRLICLFKGHKWDIDWTAKYMQIPPWESSREKLYKYLHTVCFECARCGKTKESVI